MHYKKKLYFTVLLLLIVVAIRIYASNSLRVETGFATQIYPNLSKFFRHLLGWLPISFGDILYGIFFIWMMVKLVKAFKHIFTKKVTWKGSALNCWKILIVALKIYISFNLFWGINYNRKGIGYQLGLTNEKYTIEDVKKVNEILLQKVNESKQILLLKNEQYPTNKQLFLRVNNAYQQIDSLYPFLAYKPVCIKSSLWGWLGNYTGFSGYYNPFTGEAQVNTTIPKFLQPFTTCHEVAHQLGYAKENEANFVGFLAATLSTDTLLHYSTYLDMFLYSNRNLYVQDTASAKLFASQLLPQIKDDIKEMRIFFAKHKNPIEPFVRWGYGHYLKQNQQPQGMLSYDAVTTFLIAYYRKFGKL